MVDFAGTALTRGPLRKERILRAAAKLVARNGFHAVSMAEIGASAGVTGPAIYRHFESKSAVLVALFDRVIDRLLEQTYEIVRQERDTNCALLRLIEGQVEFVLSDRLLAQVYYTEINHLPDEDGRRLRRKQRLYIEEWVHLLSEKRQDLNEVEARTVVHAAIGAIQSTLFHRDGHSVQGVEQLLRRAAGDVLGVANASCTPQDV
jgi:AcrR family transcriptional regulator